MTPQELQALFVLLCGALLVTAGWVYILAWNRLGK